MPDVIKPTVGRVVEFVPGDHVNQFGFVLVKGKPHAAVVSYVHSDRMVNLAVFDVNGRQFGRTNVTLVQPDDPTPPGGDYCRWMQFQIGQAKKAEELQQKLDDAKQAP